MTTLPSVPRVRRTFAGEEVEEFYINLFKKGVEAAVNSLLQRYQSRPLQISNFLRSLLEDQVISHDDIKAVSVFMTIEILQKWCVNISYHSLR